MKEIILTASVLILVLIALRGLLRGKLNPTFQYSLWLLAALRLLIPGSLFATPVSIMGILEEAAGRTAIIDTVPASGPAQSGGPALGISQAVPQQDLPVYRPGQAGAVEQAGGAAGLSAQAVWHIGIGLTGGALLLSNGGFYLRLRNKRRRLAMPGCPLPVYLVEGLPSPCLFGILRPAIYINEAALEPERLEHILLHEEIHWRHGDHIWALLRCLCLAVHWFNPLVWWAAALCRRDCELACDDGVIRRLGEDQRLLYGSTLVSMVAPSAGNPLRTATTMTAGKRTMLERVSLIAKRPRTLKITAAAVVLVVGAAAILAFGGAAEQPEAPPAESASSQTLSTGQDEPAPLPISGFTGEPGPTAAANYTHSSGMFSLQLPESWADAVTIMESEDGVDFYLTEQYTQAMGQSRQSDSGWLMSVIPQPVYWAESHGLERLPGSEFAFNGTAYAYVLLENSEAGPFAPAETLRSTAQSFRLLADDELIVRLVHGAYKDDPALAIPYLPYLSWSCYTGAYGEAALMELLVALWDFAGKTELTWDQYHDILSAPSDGSIDGAYASMYQDMLWRLYEKKPQQLASVLASEFLSDSERGNALQWLRYPLTEKAGKSQLLSDMEIWHLLGIPIQSHFDVTLQAAGDSFQLLPLGEDSAVTIRYSSDDPSVASVAQDSIVTAEGPGVTQIRMRIEGGGWAYDGLCTVRCRWEDAGHSAFLSDVESFGAFALIDYLTGPETWDMEGLQALLEKGYAAALAGSPLEGCLAAVTISPDFRFPAEPASGQTLQVPVTPAYHITSGGEDLVIPVPEQICHIGLYEEGGAMPEDMMWTLKNIARMDGMAAWEQDNQG